MAHQAQMIDKQDYFSRRIDHRLGILLNSSKIVEIEGILGCGKSWTALAHSQSATHVGDREIVLPIIRTNPRIALAGPAPHLVDEWQLVPELKELMFREAGRPGSYLSTSSVQTEVDDVFVHRHASRSTLVRMHPCSLFESGDSTGRVSLEVLRDGLFLGGASALGIQTTASLACCGGWPRGVGLEEEPRRRVAESCVEDAIIQAASICSKKVSTASSVLAAIAESAGEDSSYANLCEYIGKQGLKAPSRTTMATYVKLLERLFLVEEVPGWDAPIRSASRVKTKPRLYPADPTMVTAFRQLAGEDLLQNAPLLASALRSMVLRDLLVAAEALDSNRVTDIRYYADADGLEIDFVLFFEDGSWAPINVELGEGDVPQSAKRLMRLYKKLAANPDSNLQAPCFSAIILGSATRHWRDQPTGAAVFPINDFK